MNTALLLQFAPVPGLALVVTIFVFGLVLGAIGALSFVRPPARCSCPVPVVVVVSAARDEEGWVLLGADGEVLPWPDDWPDEETCDHDANELGLYLFARGWHKVTEATKEVWLEIWLKP